MYLVTSPFWLQWLYPTLTWHKSRTEKFIYLTFDDGPIPVVTPFVLNTLREFNAKATFFCIGDNVKKHPEIFKQVLGEGHAVGNHTYNHLNGWHTDDKVYIENVNLCSEVVPSSLFRPPYGRGKKSQYSLINTHHSIIMWDILSGDFDVKLSPEKCLLNVINHAQNGSIIVFHDSLKAKPRLEYALPRALEILSKKGYSFKSLK
ncbi:MAG: polysaccharide deacetylase [Sphingobacteriales bacterium]|nr:polysaccharide deacetylase [Sphingobacteriales bacterium]